MKAARCPLCDGCGAVIPAPVTKPPGALWGSADACRLLGQRARTCPLCNGDGTQQTAQPPLPLEEEKETHDA